MIYLSSGETEECITCTTRMLLQAKLCIYSFSVHFYSHLCVLAWRHVPLLLHQVKVVLSAQLPSEMFSSILFIELMLFSVMVSQRCVKPIPAHVGDPGQVILSQGAHSLLWVESPFLPKWFQCSRCKCWLRAGSRRHQDNTQLFPHCTSNLFNLCLNVI